MRSCATLVVGSAIAVNSILNVRAHGIAAEEAVVLAVYNSGLLGILKTEARHETHLARHIVVALWCHSIRTDRDGSE
jgi:hypothetical protein